MIAEAITKLAREESGRVLALLASRFGSVDLADDSVQDALLQAVETWPTAGIPNNPAGWLYSVAHNRAIDRLRRAASADRRLRAAAPELTRPPEEPEEVPIVEALIQDELFDERGEVGDEQLRLMLLCCHPALDRDTQVALTLRLLGGLTTSEIAAAFLLPEATLAQRIVRAKRKIRDARIPLSIPAELDERVEALLTVLYLVFNEGYLARGESQDAVRVSLADEAVRLTIVARSLLPGNAEVEGLLALELYHRARLDTRLDGAGDIVQLENQDRSRWDGELISRANTILRRVLGREAAGPFQLQALIASQHANAATPADTDWTLIADLYVRLLEVSPSPVVALNHAVAVAMADGPRAGLALLDGIGAEGALEGYHLFHASRGELLARAGDRDAARAAFVQARELAANPAEQRHLDRRIAAV
ncbi:MAG TPA: sigma-70 family RNA polymerase sigma factor [Solirubrobacteraceae bacterium]|nr:sigma-70 family RNA polymerase sigma factor [Solirubrobacteraceae bacterium]